MYYCVIIIVFNRKETFHVLQVIHMATHWIQLWVFLLHLDQRDLMVAGCARLLLVAQDFFSRHRQHISRLL